MYQLCYSTRWESDLSSVKQIAAGDSHTCALLTGGTVKCWGREANGRLANGATSNHSKAGDAVKVASGGEKLTKVSQIAAGADHTCALIDVSSDDDPSNPGSYSDNIVKCWGEEDYKRLGNNSTDNQNYPVSFHVSPSDPNDLTGIQKVVAGEKDTCVILANDDVKCRGGSFTDNTDNSQDFTDFGHYLEVVP